MFFNKVFHFVKGYVIINVSGFYIERFLYICAKQGIELFKIGKRTDNGVVVCINIKDFKRIRPIVSKTKVKVSILKKYGLPFYFKRAKKRRALVAGILLLSLLAFISSGFIWSIEIDSNDETVTKQLLDAIDLAGVRIGAYKPLLPEGEKIKSIIMNNTDNIVWAWVYIKGTKALVDFKEGILAPRVVDRSIPCDIVATKDGVITEIIEKNGEARVMSGDTVTKGDLLIAGTLDMPDGSYKTVHSIGNVYARVWHEKSGEYKLYVENEIPTGKKKDFITLKLFSKCFNLYLNENVDYSDYKINERLSELKLGKDNFLGVGFYKKTYNEIERQRVNISVEEVLEIAKNDLEMQISKELLPGSTFVDKKIDYEQIDDETIKVTLTMEFIEQIGKEVPFT